MPGLSVTSLTLSHFRSHLSARLALDPRPVALYGRNGAGKTNLLEAVSLLSPGRGLRRVAAGEMSRQPEAIGWKIAATLQVPGTTHEVETWLEGAGTRQVRIDDKSAPQAELGRLVRILWLIPSMDRLWIEGPENRRRFLDRMTLSFLPGHGDAALGYERAMRERNRLLRDDVHDPHWYAALESRMAETGAEITANRRQALIRITTAQGSAETTFPAAELTLESDTPDSAEEFAVALADHRGRDRAAGRTLLGPHRAELGAIYATKGVAARDCSTGEQKALLVSLVLANARALATEIGAPPILLLDEIAAHLDSDRRAALYAEIVALGAQAWMTGTGPELFAPLGTEAQYIEIRDSGSLSATHPAEWS